MTAQNISGMAKFFYEKPNGQRSEVIYQARSEILAPNVSSGVPSQDTRLWAEAPFTGMAVGQGGYITIEYTADATATTDSTDHTFIIPVLLENRANGQKTAVVLSKEDFNNSDTSGATTYQDIALTANVPAVIGKYQVPTGYNAYFGGHGKIFLDVRDNTA